MTTLLCPRNGSMQSVHTEKQQAFLRSSRGEVTPDHIDWLNLERHGDDYSIPREVEFRWESDRPLFRFLLSENADFTDAVMRLTTEKRVSVANLKLARTYYWKVDDSFLRCLLAVFASHQFLETHLKKTRDLRQKFDVGISDPVFPPTDGLIGHAEVFRKRVLRDLLFLAEFFQIITNVKFHSKHILLQNQKRFCYFYYNGYHTFLQQTWPYVFSINDLALAL